MEVSQVRRRVQAAMATSRERAKRRREHAAAAESTYDRFLTHVAVPLAHQIAGSLKAEGYAFTVSTPVLNTIVSSVPGTAFARVTASRSDPGPLSAALVTTTVCGRTTSMLNHPPSRDGSAARAAHARSKKSARSNRERHPIN